MIEANLKKNYFG